MDSGFVAVVVAGLLVLVALALPLAFRVGDVVVSVPEPERYTYVAWYSATYAPNVAHLALFNNANYTLYVYRVVVCGELSDPAEVRLSRVSQLAGGVELAPTKLDPGAPEASGVVALGGAEVDESAVVVAHVLRSGCVTLYEKVAGVQPLVVPPGHGVAVVGGSQATGSLSCAIVFAR